MADIVKTSHDSVNRFLLREADEPKEFDEAKSHINLVGDTLLVIFGLENTIARLKAST